MNRALRILSTALITAGLTVLADVGLTLIWKEPLSTAYGQLQQNQAEDKLADLERAFPAAGDFEAAGSGSLRERVGVLADRFARRTAGDEGTPIGRIEIPEVGLDAVIIEGIDTASLQKGPGHYTRSDDPATRRQGDGSAFPGQGKTVGIAGHRTTYLAPFRKLNELSAGDEVSLELPYATFTYEIEKTEIVDPSEFQVVKDVGYERLVMTACHPLYSAAQRIVTFAKLKQISLFGSGNRIWQDP